MTVKARSFLKHSHDMKEKAGLYIHFPFCKRKCPYCHFYSIAGERKVFKKWLEGVILEMSLYSGIFLEFDTLYIGGGTPSLLYPDDIFKILELAKEIFKMKNFEFTIEVNPDLKDRGIIKGWKDAGINRLSIGIQSFDSDSLEILGRDYKPTKAIDFYFKCREEGHENINIDLMIGIPGEKENNAEKIIENIKIMEPDHISIYILESYEGLPFEELIKKYGCPDDEFVYKEYYKLKRELEALKYKHYEISNFAEKGKESIHNLKYWKYFPFIGLGPSACSNLVGRRWCNIADFEDWLKSLKERRNAKEEILELGGEEVIKEAIILGLRLIDGIDLKEFNKRFEVEVETKYSYVIKSLIDENLLILKEDRIKINEDKLLLSNEIFLRFL
ncbi:MAG: radical SAM family heme chaperone HemW [Candidatus Aminicenantia bacterium]